MTIRDKVPKHCFGCLPNVLCLPFLMCFLLYHRWQPMSESADSGVRLLCCSPTEPSPQPHCEPSRHRPAPPCQAPPAPGNTGCRLHSYFIFQVQSDPLWEALISSSPGPRPGSQIPSQSLGERRPGLRRAGLLSCRCFWLTFQVFFDIFLLGDSDGRQLTLKLFLGTRSFPKVCSANSEMRNKGRD